MPTRSSSGCERSLRSTSWSETFPSGFCKKTKRSGSPLGHTGHGNFADTEGSPLGRVGLACPGNEGGFVSSGLDPISANSNTQPVQWSPANNPFQQLGKALASGDLSAAQQAFSALQQNAPQQAASAQGSQTAQGSTGQNAIAALGTALQSGNLAAAQQAFAQIQQTSGHHHHHHRSQGSSSAPTTQSTAAAAPDVTDSTGGNLNVTA